MLLTAGVVLAHVSASYPWLGREEIDRERFRQITHVEPELFAEYRPIIDPLGQLNRVVRRQAESYELRWRPSEPWRMLAAKPRHSRYQALQPMSLKAAREVSLRGLRVVLDPGHRGGAWSRAEGRHIQDGPGAAVREGDLTWATVVQIKSILEGAGAVVLLTRDAPPALPFPEERFDGYNAEEEARQWSWELIHGPALRHLRSFSRSWLGRQMAPMMISFLPTFRAFKLYNRYELRERSRRAEAFDPHVTLSIHYNMTSDPVKNGVIVFLLGNFSVGELSTASQRFYALQALSSGDLDRARKLAQTMSRAMQQEFKLKALSQLPKKPPSQAHKLPVVAEEGVFARNLAVLRRASGVALLLEGPCMNAAGEFRRLQQMDVELLDGSRAPSRTRQYANAVLRALATQRDLLLANPS